MLKVLVVLLGLMNLTGCAELGAIEEDEVLFRSGSATKSDGVELTPESGCTITMCLTGAMNHETPSNEAFEDCVMIIGSGVVEDYGPFGCNKTFDSFFQFPDGVSGPL